MVQEMPKTSLYKKILSLDAQFYTVLPKIRAGLKKSASSAFKRGHRKIIGLWGVPNTQFGLA